MMSLLKDYPEVFWFLARVGDGYIELSQDKVRREYLYTKKKAKELLEKYNEN